MKKFAPPLLSRRKLMGLGLGLLMAMVCPLPGYAGPYEVGLKLYSQGDYATASRYFLEAASQGSSNPNVHYYLADSYLKLNRLAEAVPLVIITNSDTAHAERLSKNLEAPFEVVISAEEMRAYKPRMRAFEYLFDKLDVTPDELVHVSASPMYDHRTAATMGIENKVYVDRGFEHDEHWLGYERITDIADLPVLFGLPRP